MLRSRECLRYIRSTDVNISSSVPLRRRLHIRTISRATLRCRRLYPGAYVAFALPSGLQSNRER